MSTPPRLVELECPICHNNHWEIDYDFRESRVQRELSYKERSYDCPCCSASRTGYQVIQKSPAAFLIQPHPLYPMNISEFGHWYSIFQSHFPCHKKLGRVGVSWYPGEPDEVHEARLRQVCTIGEAHRYRFCIENRSPEDVRISVGVHGGGGAALFWIDSAIELDDRHYGLEEDQLKEIRDLILAKKAEVQAAWNGFKEYATQTQKKWLTRIGGSPAV